MYTFILSCALVYYMYEKAFRLQKRIDILEYEMTNLTRVIFMPTAPLLDYKKQDLYLYTEYDKKNLPSAPSMEILKL